MSTKEHMLGEVNRWLSLGYVSHDVGGSVLDLRDEIVRHPYDQIDWRHDLTWRFNAMQNDVRLDNVHVEFRVEAKPGFFLTDEWLGIMKSSMYDKSFRGLAGHEVVFRMGNVAYWSTTEYPDAPYSISADDLISFAKLQVEVTDKDLVTSAVVRLYNPLAPMKMGSRFMAYEEYNLPCSD